MRRIAEWCALNADRAASLQNALLYRATPLRHFTKRGAIPGELPRNAGRNANADTRIARIVAVMSLPIKLSLRKKLLVFFADGVAKLLRQLLVADARLG